MLMKTILLIVASHGYQPMEYNHTRKVLEGAGVRVVVTSDKPGIASANPNLPPRCGCQQPRPAPQAAPRYESIKVDIVLDQINPKDYDGIFIIGGPGALQFLNNEITHKIMHETAASGKLYGAICISPRILAEAGLLKGKKATGWDGDHKLDSIFTQYGTFYARQGVVIDGNLITANGPQSAMAFGHAIVETLKKTDKK